VVIPARAFDKSAAGEKSRAQGIICKNRDDEAFAIFGCFRITLLSMGEHFVFKFCRAEVRMHVQADLAAAEVVEHSGDPAVGSFPKYQALFERFANSTGCDEMPAPIIEAGDVPTMFETVVEQEDLAQEIANAPEVIFFIAGAQRKFHLM
jgi:hypothetical protein